jgi:hypothetical protein
MISIQSIQYSAFPSTSGLPPTGGFTCRAFSTSKDLCPSPILIFRPAYLRVEAWSSASGVVRLILCKARSPDQDATASV